MLDFFSTLTWQHQILFFETIISGLIGLWMTGITFHRSKTTMKWFLAWNAAVFALLITGADHMAWQYVVLFMYYLLDTAAVVYYHGHRKVTTPEDFGPGVVWAYMLLILFLLTMLVTGA